MNYEINHTINNEQNDVVWIKAHLGQKLKGRFFFTQGRYVSWIILWNKKLQIISIEEKMRCEVKRLYGFTANLYIFTTIMGAAKTSIAWFDPDMVIYVHTDI